MKIEIKEMPRASDGDSIELEGKVIRALKPNKSEFKDKTVWNQFIVLKDSTGEQGCWLKLDGEEDKVSKNSSLKVKGKVGKEYEDSKGKMQRSLNNCVFEGDKKEKTSTSTKNNGNGRDGYWEKKFVWDQKVHFSIVRECAIKAVTELAKIAPSKTFLIKVHTEKDYFNFADKIKDYICRKLTGEDITKESGGTKEERIEKAEEVVGETRFRPASTEQKKCIYGYRNNEDKWCKGIIESRYMEKPEIREIREIGAPEKLSLEDATEWLLWWWGPDKKSGERKKRELEHPRNEDGTLVGDLVKGDKTSLVKDDLVDDINAWRRENFLIDDERFKDEMGYNPKLEKLSEEDLLKIKKLIKNFHPKNWDDKNEEDDEDFIHPDKLD